MLEDPPFFNVQPGEIPKIKGMSENAFHGCLYLDKFDMLFAESFYTGKWFDGVNQEDILKAVKCPVVYLKAKTKYGKDGVLWAANTDESADKIMHLLNNVKKKVVRSGHFCRSIHAGREKGLNAF